MNKFLLIALLVLNFNFSKGQVFPLTENFNTMTPFTSPSGGWISTVAGFQIYPNHGNASQGMTKQLTTFQYVDSVISPLVGPIAANSFLSFDYRAVLSSLYPSSAATLGSLDKIEIKVLSAGSVTTLFTINSTNHITSTSFTNLAINNLSAFTGSSIKIIIKVFRNPSASTQDFFYDFDNFAITNAQGIKENNIEYKNINAYPNPIQKGNDIHLKDIFPGTYNILLFDLQGKEIFTLTRSIIDGDLFLYNNNKFESGIYYLKLQNDQHNYVSKVIVQ